MKLNTTVKPWGLQGRIMDDKLKPFVGKKVTVTIDVDEGTEVTTLVKETPDATVISTKKVA